MKHTIHIVHTEYETAICLDGKVIHNGTGEHTRNALGALAEDFAENLSADLYHCDHDHSDGDFDPEVLTDLTGAVKLALAEYPVAPATTAPEHLIGFTTEDVKLMRPDHDFTDDELTDIVRSCDRTDWSFVTDSIEEVVGSVIDDTIDS